jgi:hypothetical protein
MVMIVAIALWLRADYSGQQAAWASADALVNSGVPAAAIAAPLHWAEYRGAFDQWIAGAAPGYDPSQPSDRGRDALNDPFYAWLNARSARASYRFVDAATPYDPDEWRLIQSVPYRSARFSRHQLLTTPLITLGVTAMPDVWF